ncbi:hypothetical protein Pmani_007411 [Petrolisthes manimaculis]|uniref:Uncharacterized protein n=1 Tax=Petrolisthes manimaculis TaxID=1843537 RepID=A0AAE1UET8_9EUCA|nr:hypothetical protein Pmani_007411 [Petrolisthes manimaculis]
MSTINTRLNAIQYLAENCELVYTLQVCRQPTLTWPRSQSFQHGAEKSGESVTSAATQGCLSNEGLSIVIPSRALGQRSPCLMKGTAAAMTPLLYHQELSINGLLHVAPKIYSEIIDDIIDLL